MARDASRDSRPIRNRGRRSIDLGESNCPRCKGKLRDSSPQLKVYDGWGGVQWRDRLTCRTCGWWGFQRQPQPSQGRRNDRPSTWRSSP